MLLRLAHLGVANVFALLRLLPVNNQDKDAEILALRHQITVLERRLGRDRVRCLAPPRGPFPARACGAAAYGALDPRSRAASGAGEFRVGISAHPRRAAGCERAGGRLHGVGDPEGDGDRPGTRAGFQPWTDFLRSRADALLACDFFEAVTLSGTRLYVFAVIGHAGRRIRVLGATAHPTASWVAQATRNLVINLQDAGCQARYVIRDRDRDGKFPELFNTVLEDAGIEVVLSRIRMPRMNALMERWVQTCRRELLDRTLIWNQRHLLHALREFEQFYNAHRPHQGIANACPLHPLPEPITDHRSERNRPPRPTSNRPTRRPPSRVPACCATRPDEISGKGKVSTRTSPWPWSRRLPIRCKAGGCAVRGRRGRALERRHLPLLHHSILKSGGKQQVKAAQDTST